MIMRVYLIFGLILLGATGWFIVGSPPPTVQLPPTAGDFARLREEGILPEEEMEENENIEHDIFGVPPEDEAMIEAASEGMDMDMGSMDMGDGTTMDMGDGTTAMNMDMDGDGVMDMAAEDMPATTAMDMGDGTTAMNMDMDGDGVMDMAAEDMPATTAMDMGDGATAMNMDMDGDGVMDMAAEDMADQVMDMAEDAADMADQVMDMAEGVSDMADQVMDMAEGATSMGMDMDMDGDGVMDMASGDMDDGDVEHAEDSEAAEEEAERLMAGQMAGLIIRDDGAFDREIELTMTEWGFSDLDINAKAGERIKFTLRNEGQILHEFMFMGMAQMQGVNYRARRADWNLLEHEALYEKSLMLPGDEVTFVAEVVRPGAWMFMCMLPYHMQMGMMGQLSTDGMAMAM